MHIEMIAVRFIGKQKIPRADRPELLVQLNAAAPSIAELVHGPVVGPAPVDVPVEKSCARIVSIAVAVEVVSDGELADRHRDSRNVLFARNLIGTILDAFLFSTKSQSLAYEHPRDI